MTNSIYPVIDPAPHYTAQTYAGKVVLITGASRGVGRETALQYARAGASVAIVARTTDGLAETRDRIAAATAAQGGREADVLVLTADVRDIESARDAVRSVLQRFGKLDILIANAGAITSFTPSKPITLPAPRIFFRFFYIDVYTLPNPSAGQEGSSCVVEHI